MVPRQLLAPHFVITHALVAGLAAAFVTLGLWQVQRLGEVREESTRLEQRLAAPAQSLDAVAADGIEPATDEFRPVEVTGRYLVEEEVLQRSRSHRGVNGYHVLTPLEYADGQAIFVRRGWVPFDLDQPPVVAAAPPVGAVTVSGYLERSDVPSGWGARDPADGRLERVFHADVERLGQQVSAELFPMVLHLESQAPPQRGDLPIPADRPDFDASRHLSYAIQWFSFAAIALVGYAVFVRSRLRRSDAGTPSVDDRQPVG